MVVDPFAFSEYAVQIVALGLSVRFDPKFASDASHAGVALGGLRAFLEGFRVVSFGHLAGDSCCFLVVIVYAFRARFANLLCCTT